MRKLRTRIISTGKIMPYGFTITTAKIPRIAIRSRKIWPFRNFFTKFEITFAITM